MRGSVRIRRALPLPPPRKQVRRRTADALAPTPADGAEQLRAALARACDEVEAVRSAVADAAGGPRLPVAELRSLCA